MISLDAEPRGGSWNGVTLTWRTASGVTLETTAKNYKSGDDVAFEWTLPAGANGTSQVARSRDAVIVQWPPLAGNLETMKYLKLW